MLLAFKKISGGMTTLIGTPLKLFVSGFRAEAGMGRFGMPVFAPVGLAFALLWLMWRSLRWRLVIARKQ